MAASRCLSFSVALVVALVLLGTGIESERGNGVHAQGPFILIPVALEAVKLGWKVAEKLIPILKEKSNSTLVDCITDVANKLDEAQSVLKNITDPHSDFKTDIEKVEEWLNGTVNEIGTCFKDLENESSIVCSLVKELKKFIERALSIIHKIIDQGHP